MKSRSSVASVSRVCVVGICIVSVFAATFTTAGRSDSVPRCCRCASIGTQRAALELACHVRVRGAAGSHSAVLFSKPL